MVQSFPESSRGIHSSREGGQHLKLLTFCHSAIVEANKSATVN